MCYLRNENKSCIVRNPFFPTIDRTVNNIAVQSFVAVYGFPAFEEAQGVIIRVGLFHGYRIACRKVEDNDVVAFYRAESFETMVVPLGPFDVRFRVEKGYGMLGEREV